jgi:hypothetical protein
LPIPPAVALSRPDTAVIPVIDYEPPTRALPRCLPSSHAPLRAPTTRPRLRGKPADAEPAESTCAPLSPQMRQAAVFADAALRRVLEVIDRRRPAAALRSVLAPCLVDSVLSVTRAVAGEPGAAVLRRMRLQPVDSDSAASTTAEVFGTYSRGDRIHAIACRVEQLPTTGRWLVVALHIG